MARLTALPADNREVVRAGRPIEIHRLLVELLEFHCELTFLDFVLREDLEVRSKANELHDCDEPLGWIILIPLDGIAIVHWELVMEVMVTLSEGDKRGKNVIARSVLIVEGGFTKPVSERVDTEGRLSTKGESDCSYLSAKWTHVVDKEQTSKRRIEITATPIAPEVTRNDGRDDNAHQDEEPDEPFMLPTDDRVAGEIRDISDARLATRLEDHPTDMRPEEPMMGAIGVEVSVSVTMMSTVTARPPLDRTLNSTRASECKEVFERTRSVVGTMGPEAVVTGSNTHTGEKVVEHGEEGSLELERSSAPAVNRGDRSEGEGDEGNPLSLRVQVFPSNRGKLLLVGENLLDIVVGNVNVYWGVLITETGR